MWLTFFAGRVDFPRDLEKSTIDRQHIMISAVKGSTKSMCMDKMVCIATLVISSLLLVGHTESTVETTESDSPKSAVSLRFLAENKKIIPVYVKMRDNWITDIKLPRVLVQNNMEEDIRIVGIDISGKSSGQEVVRYRLPEEYLNSFIEDENSYLNRRIADRTKNVTIENLKVKRGEFFLPEGEFAESNVLNPAALAVIPLSDMVHLHYMGKNKIDQLAAELIIKGEPDDERFTFLMRLIPYESKGDYIFPLKGHVCICAMPMNIVEHRGAFSQEFAFDILDARLTERGEYASSEIQDPDNVVHYFIWHRDVLAIGDGIVVDVENHFPDSTMKNPQLYSIEYISNLIKKLVNDLGLMGALAGNYVIIDHENGEFSLYAHMSENTILVKVGDRVKQGQVIGKVGNTGNSTEPHLQFQLMDDANFFTANGLPVMFRNVPVTHMNFNFEESNSLLYTDYIFLNIIE
jgi:hypothetical protein